MTEPACKLQQLDRDGRLAKIPLLSPIELEVLRQLRMTTWDGNLVSKTGRDSLVRRGLAIRFNGWQVVSAMGLTILETLGMLDDREIITRIKR